MTLSSVSTLSLTNALLEPIQRIQTALSQDQIESATGQYADIGLQLGEQSGYELSLRNQSSLLQTLTSANSVISTNLTTTQDALDSLSQGAQSVLHSLASYLPGSAPGVPLQDQGVNALQQLVSLVNTTSNGQYVFGGQNTGVAPLADYSASSKGTTAIAQAFQAAFGVSPTDPSVSTISASALQAFLNGAFADLFSGTSFSAYFSSASSVNATAEIAPGQRVEVTTSANQPGVQELTQAYTLLATFAGASLGQAAQQVVVSTASSLLSKGVSDITSTQASIGTVQQQIGDANTFLASQQTLLQTQIGNLDNVDPAKVVTELNTLSTQLQAAYQLTAQLQKLSLAQYLPA